MFCGVVIQSPFNNSFGDAKYALVLHNNSSSEAYRAVYKVLHGIFTGLSLVILSEIQKK